MLKKTPLQELIRDRVNQIRARLDWTKPRSPELFALAQWPDANVLVHITPKRGGPHRVNFIQSGDNSPDGAARLANAAREKGLTEGVGLGVLTPNQYQSFPREAAEAPEEELTAIMRWRIKEQLDFSVEEAVVDVHPLPSQARDDDQVTRMVNVVAAHQQEVMKQAAFFGRLQTELTRVDAFELALCNLLSANPKIPDSAVMLHVGARESLVVAMADGAMIFSRRLKSGGSEQIREARIETEPDPAAALARGVEPLAQELQRTLEFIRTRFGIKPEAVHLAPMESPIKALGAAIEARLDWLKVEQIDLEGIFRFRDGTPEEGLLARALPALGGALGCAKEGGRQINLLDARFRPRKELVTGARVLTAAGASLGLLVAVAALMHLQAWLDRSELGENAAREKALFQEVSELARQYRDLAVTSDLAGQLAQMEARISRDQRILTYLEEQDLGNAGGFAGHLEDMARFQTPGVWLTRFTVADGGREIALAARGTSAALAPNFLETLGQGANFSNRAFHVLRIREQESGGVLFEVRTKRIAGITPELDEEQGQ